MRSLCRRLLVDSNRKLPIVMALLTTFRQCAPDTTKFGKITQNKGHFAVQFHSRSPIFVPIESLYTTSYHKNSSGDEIANVNFLRTISHTRRPL